MIVAPRSIVRTADGRKVGTVSLLRVDSYKGVAVPEVRKRHDREFRDGAVRIVEEAGKPIAQVARDLGVNEGALGNWGARAREAREGLSRGDLAELKRLRAENAELLDDTQRMKRDVLKRSVVLWVKEATR